MAKFVRVHLVDGTSKTLPLEATTTVGEVYMALGEKIGLPRALADHTKFAMWAVEEESAGAVLGRERMAVPLAPSACVADVLAVWPQLVGALDGSGAAVANNSFAFTDGDAAPLLRFSRSPLAPPNMWRVEDGQVVDAVYAEAAALFLSSSIEVAPAAALELIGLMVHVAYGDARAGVHVPGFFARGIAAVVPSALRNAKGFKPASWEKKILAEHKKHVGRHPLLVKLLFLHKLHALSPVLDYAFFCASAPPPVESAKARKRAAKSRHKLTASRIGINAAAVLFEVPPSSGKASAAPATYVLDLASPDIDVRVQPGPPLDPTSLLLVTVSSASAIVSPPDAWALAHGKTLVFAFASSLAQYVLALLTALRTSPTPALPTLDVLLADQGIEPPTTPTSEAAPEASAGAASSSTGAGAGAVAGAPVAAAAGAAASAGVADDGASASGSSGSKQSTPDKVAALSALSLITVAEDANYSKMSLASVPAELATNQAIGTVCTLRLDRNQLTTLPPLVGSLSRLTALNLSYNDLTAVPLELGQLGSLTKLELVGNALTEWPEAMEGLTKVQVLDLERNFLTSLPASLARLRSLARLQVSKNEIADVSAVPWDAGFEHLVLLDLSHNKLGELPASMASLLTLRVLDLQSNALLELPDVLSQLPVLFKLNVSDNRIAELPASLFDLDALKDFSADRNALVGFATPTAAQAKSAKRSRLLPSLTTISLVSNRLTDIPEILFSLPRLLLLDVTDNALAAISPSIGKLKNSLCVFSAGMNELTELPVELFSCKRLQELSVPANAIRVLPSKVLSLGALWKLHVGDNALVALPNLSKLSSLGELVVSGNELSSLPSWVLSHPGLEAVYAARNCVAQLMGSRLTAPLEVLDLEHNELPAGAIPLMLTDGDIVHWKHNPGAPDMYVPMQGVENLAGELLEPVVINPDAARFPLGTADMIGVRESMEDALLVAWKLWGEPDGVPVDVLGVFDGHGGSFGSKFVADTLPDMLVKLRQRADAPALTAGSPAQRFHAVATLLTTAIAQTEAALKSAIKARLRRNPRLKFVGTTGVMALLAGSHLYIANVGDSRAVLWVPTLAPGETTDDAGPVAQVHSLAPPPSYPWTPFGGGGFLKRLSHDHKPESADERQRIRSQGGYVGDECRVNDIVAVSRAIGDFYVHPWVSSIPDITGCFDVTGLDGSILLMACDGVWDVLSDAQAMAAVRAELAAFPSAPDLPARAASKVRDLAYQLGSGDNISVMVVLL